MAKDECLLFFRVGWSISIEPPVRGRGLVLTGLPYVHPINQNCSSEPTKA
jgi:hypothetical protein